MLHERYDRWYEENRILAANEAKAVSRALEGAPRPILEVGVGTGFFASLVGAEAGLDPSLGMLRKARERGVPLLVAGVGERMPFRSRVFGSALIVVTLCFADDPQELLRETWRILAWGGVLVSCIVPRDSSWGEYYEARGRAGHPFYSKARFITNSMHHYMLRSVGFSLERQLATLSFKPWERPREEEPVEAWSGDYGFVCTRARKHHAI
ncbi:class I SAM-dependent methyltransferase [Aeropyrum camini]|uniref:SAM-dependent methyltransferase n=1 Tax=Aeropyrum camini SY1 = JCM 12091 TaxID=1198449 RepID=U3TE13_9CREN|nr:methyltransferase domain-containing protein [Aeropyrum camini]BAN90656.1 SAM-dependent methyltransferase [Aeropyrum camini SY1 = JCM 12091]